MRWRHEAVTKHLLPGGSWGKHQSTPAELSGQCWLVWLRAGIPEGPRWEGTLLTLF